MADVHAPYKVAHIDDMPFEEGSSPGTEWKPVRRIFDIGSFGTALARATEAGDTLTHDHDEVSARHEELFLIVSGHATYRVDGEEIDAPAGTFLYVPDPATVRGVVAARGRHHDVRRRSRARRGVRAVGLGHRAAAGVKGAGGRSLGRRRAARRPSVLVGLGQQALEVERLDDHRVAAVRR